MNKIVFKRARIKNFLSYGNTWQDIVFPDGMTLIQGLNKDTGKSNGSGKSSFTEIIPFALFGKTIKDLPQAKVVNWYNRNGCMVELFFSVGDNDYIFKRGLRPNKFIVELNGVEVVRPADAKSLQWQMEDEVIGMDFKTFKNLIYFSPNNTISILGAKKDDKRKFLESLFDLTEYSEMLKITNSKIRTAETRVVDANSKIENSNRIIDLLKEDISNIKIPDIKDMRLSISKLELLIEGLKEKDIDDSELALYDGYLDHLKTLKEQKVDFDKEVVYLSQQLKSLNKDKDAVDLDTPIKLTEMITGKIQKLEEDIDGIDESKMADELVEAKEMTDTNSEEISNHKETLTTLDKRLELATYVISSEKDNIGTIEARKHNISGKDVCDFCGSECDHDKIAHHHDSQIAEHKEKIVEQEQILEDGRKTKIEIVEYVTSLTNQNNDLSKVIDDIKRKMRSLDEMSKEVENLKDKLTMVPDVGKLEQKIRDLDDSIEKDTDRLSTVNHKIDMIQMDIEDYDKKVKDLEALKVEVDNHNKLLSDSEAKLEAEMIRLNDFTDRIAALDKDKQDKEDKILEEKDQIRTFESDIVKLNKMLDHLNYLRESLKDDNVKQFAISALLPFLNQRANYYLSESGFPYVVDIDGWLDVTIMGMGTEGVGYNSLSGGESKAMDMAIQLACNDIAELHAKTLLGVSIYDEIMDTSLDYDGVTKLMDIIKVKQRDTNNCIAIISHRDEVKEMDFDNYIMVEKENGFSVIQNQNTMV